jgi:hypothetical protein
MKTHRVKLRSLAQLAGEPITELEISESDDSRSFRLPLCARCVIEKVAF